MLLERLGFAPSDIQDSPWRTADRLWVRAVIEGEPAQLEVKTAMPLDVWLERTYVERRGFPVTWRDERFGVCQVGEFTILGRQRRFDTAVVGTEKNDYPRNQRYAGSVGPMFFEDGLLALDFVEGRVARADASRAIALPPSEAALALVPEGWNGVTFVRDITVAGMSEPGVFLVASDMQRSTLSIDYVRRAASPRLVRKYERYMERKCVVSEKVALPDGPTVTHDFRVGSWIAKHVKNWQVACDGVLGADFLRRWIPVFDFPAQRIRLIDYATVLPSFRRL